MEEASLTATIVVGSYGEYKWLTSTGHSIDTMIQLCPEVVLGRYLAVTSTDSGDPKPWAEKLAGWECRGGIAYSPRLGSTEGLVCQIHGPECPGFDEWYTFEAPLDLGQVIVDENPFEEQFRPRPGRLMAFVNYYYTPDQTDSLLGPMFWRQLEEIRPESYISDGSDCVAFVSRNGFLFDAVLSCFRKVDGF